MKNKFSHLKFSIFTQHPYVLKYYLKHPIQFISHYWYDIKRAYQRATKGYSYWDLCDMDHWFKDVILRMLIEFKENTQGFPSDSTEEEWNNILDELIKLFEESDVDTCSLINTYKQEYNKWIDKNPKDEAGKQYKHRCIVDYLNVENARYEYCKNKLQQACIMLGKYLPNLWY